MSSSSWSNFSLIVSSLEESLGENPLIATLHAVTATLGAEPVCINVVTHT